MSKKTDRIIKLIKDLNISNQLVQSGLATQENQEDGMKELKEFEKLCDELTPEEQAIVLPYLPEVDENYVDMKLVANLLSNQEKIFDIIGNNPTPTPEKQKEFDEIMDNSKQIMETMNNAEFEKYLRINDLLNNSNCSICGKKLGKETHIDLDKEQVMCDDCYNRN